MEAENKQNVTLKEALTQIKRLKESQSQKSKEKRREQRNGLIRSGHYNYEDKGIDPTIT